MGLDRSEFLGRFELFEIVVWFGYFRWLRGFFEELLHGVDEGVLLRANRFGEGIHEALELLRADFGVTKSDIEVVDGASLGFDDKGVFVERLEVVDVAEKQLEVLFDVFRFFPL